MDGEIIVLGHKNPDTDSVASAISYSVLKNKLGQRCVPKVCSAITGEAKHVLELLEIEPPEVLDTMELKVIDFMNREHPYLSEEETLKNIGYIMGKEGVKSIPLVDKDNVVTGIITAGDFARLYLQEISSGETISTGIDLESVQKTLNGTIFLGDKNQLISGRIIVGAMGVEKLVSNLGENDILLIGDREDCQIQGLEHGINALILTGGTQPSEKVLELAKRKGIPVLGYPGDTFSAARLISLARKGREIMTKEPCTVDLNTTVTRVKELFNQKKYRSFPVVNEKGQYLGMVSKGEILNAQPKKIILVDHNEKSQSIDGLEWGEIIEIIDHHRLGDVQTKKPIFINCKPVGSTATLITEMYLQKGIVPEKKIAALLLAAILSDTVILKSPTTTSQDQEMALYLANLTGLDIKEFGGKIYGWSENLENITPYEIVTGDLKEFSFLKGRLALGQFETTDIHRILEKKEAISAEMEKLKNKKGLDHILMVITDIIEGDSYMLSIGSLNTYVELAFTKPENGIIYLPGVMSRKLQIVPPLSEVLNV
ncbi:manganese-dependent inorganic pyrophosphatase [Anaerobranca californiensis DSM 14826]|jgi:manganese-dependent inorganic pyrophosphatase|uniref:inorganic diphosphatase n=1 Tax=Anaerobranca californiensis DSM 14826 TaxID=1120989 RepID=A0A1M6RRA3_9FIRM|nr:putative manganese-dependent inorganic diphosphatase [Anaerobranca californiensis]SHK34999.1 manganese-dependent inorganic pyrophosphatase [Anaerobranca californiensis DSM 14826]